MVDRNWDNGKDGVGMFLLDCWWEFGLPSHDCFAQQRLEIVRGGLSFVMLLND